MGIGKKTQRRGLRLESLEERCVLSSLPLLSSIPLLPIAKLTQPVSALTQPVADTVNAVVDNTLGASGLAVELNVATPLLSTAADVTVLSSTSILSVDLETTVQPLPLLDTSSSTPLLSSDIGLDIGNSSQPILDVDTSILDIDTSIEVLPVDSGSSGSGIIDVSIGGQVGDNPVGTVEVGIGGSNDSDGNNGDINVGVDLGEGVTVPSNLATPDSLPIPSIVGAELSDIGVPDVNDPVVLTPQIDGRFPADDPAFLSPPEVDSVLAEETNDDITQEEDEETGLSSGWLASDPFDMTAFLFAGAEAMSRTAVATVPNEALSIQDEDALQALPLQPFQLMDAESTVDTVGMFDEFFMNLLGAFDSLRTWLARIGPVPWVMMGLALSLSSMELAARYRQRLLARKGRLDEPMVDEVPVF